MELLIIRHGIAEDIQPGQTDSDRRLTDTGVERTRQIALKLAKFIDPPDVILTSPKVRAAQTAEIVGEVFGVPPEVWDALAFADAEDVRDGLMERTEYRVMIVGHEPTFSELIALFVTGSERGGAFAMKKAGCACLDVPPGSHRRRRATLRWLLPPRVLLADV